MRIKNLTFQKNEWQNIWLKRGLLQTIINTGRNIYNIFFLQYLQKYTSKNTSFLEIGCGTSSLGLSLATKLEKLVGIDITESAIELSKKRALKMNVHNCNFEIGDCLDIKYTDTFDIVWSQGLMEHFEFPEKVAAQHYKATKPGGIALISIPYKYSYHTLWYILTRPKPLQFLWPWTDIVLIDRKQLINIGKKITTKARVHTLQPFLLGIIILELPK